MSILHKNEKTSWHGPAVMLAAFVVVFSAIVFLVNDNRYKAKQSELKTGSESVTKSIRLRLKGNEDYLLMLAKDRAAGALDAKLFQERAGAYVLQHPEIINITWVDADFYIRDVAPLASNKQILGLHLDLSEPKRVSRLAKDTRQPRYTRPFEAIQGKTSFEIWVPVFKGNRFLGLFGGVYSCQKTLQILVPPHLRATSHATLCDTSGNLLAALSKTGRVDQELVHKSFLTPHESGVILQLAPYSRGGADWVLLALEFLCLSLVVAMTCAMWGLKREITVRKRIERELRVKTSQLQRSEDELQKQTDQLEEELAERQMVQESLQDQRRRLKSAGAQRRP